MARRKLGDLEAAVLIAVVKESESAFALEIRRAIESATGRAVSRGAFYTTLERLGRKGLVSWENQVPPNARRELAQRRYAITPAGMRASKRRRPNSLRSGNALWTPRASHDQQVGGPGAEDDPSPR